MEDQSILWWNNFPAPPEIDDEEIQLDKLRRKLIDELWYTDENGNVIPWPVHSCIYQSTKVSERQHGGRSPRRRLLPFSLSGNSMPAITARRGRVRWANSWRPGPLLVAVKITIFDTSHPQKAKPAWKLTKQSGMACTPTKPEETKYGWPYGAPYREPSNHMGRTPATNVGEWYPAQGASCLSSCGGHSWNNNHGPSGYSP